MNSSTKSPSIKPITSKGTPALPCFNIYTHTHYIEVQWEIERRQEDRCRQRVQLFISLQFKWGGSSGERTFSSASDEMWIVSALSLVGWSPPWGCPFDPPPNCPINCRSCASISYWSSCVLSLCGWLKVKWEWGERNYSSTLTVHSFGMISITKKDRRQRELTVSFTLMEFSTECTRSKE